MLGTLLIIGVIESLAARPDAPWKPMLPSDWRTTGLAATRDALDSDILCFGDSQMKHGVLPDVIEAQTGRRAYNLALNRGQAPGSFYLLRRALRAGAKPKAIVVGFYPGLLFTHPRFNAALWPELLEPRELLELAWEADLPSLATQALLDWCLPTTQQRLEIRDALQSALRGQPYDAPKRVVALRQNWVDHRGAQANPKVPDFQDPPVNIPPEKREPPWRCNRVNERYIRRILDLAAAREIPVYWLLVTTSPSTRADREHHALDAPYERFIAGLQRDYPNLVVVDGRHVGYDRTHFIDPVHLDRDGASAFSTEVASTLRALAAKSSSRWIELTDRRQRSSDGVALERGTPRR